MESINSLLLDLLSQIASSNTKKAIAIVGSGLFIYLLKKKFGGLGQIDKETIQRLDRKTEVSILRKINCLVEASRAC